VRHNLTLLRLFAAGTFLTLLAGSSRTAHAQATENFDFLNKTSSDHANVLMKVGGQSVQVIAGRYLGKLDAAGDGFSNDKAVQMFCTDWTHHIAQGGDSFVTLADRANLSDTLNNTLTNGFYGDGNPFIPGGLGSALTTNDYLTTSNGTFGTPLNTAPTNAERDARAAQIAKLTDSFVNATLNSVVNGFTMDTNEFAAVQVAIWRIAQDGNQGGSDTGTTGNVRFLNGADVSDLVSRVDALESYVSGFTSYAGTAQWIEAQRGATANDHKQDFTYMESPPIPEPAFYQLSALLVLGGLGFRRLRKKV